MNTTQRNFALNRIYTILASKMVELKEEQQQQVSEYEAAHNIPLKEILDGIKTGKIKPHSPVKLKFCTAFSSIQSVFDISSLESKYRKNNSNLEKLLKKDQNINIRNPTPNSYGSETIYLRFKTIEVRAIRIQNRMNHAADEIMLGSNSEALLAIKDIEALTF